MSGNGAAGGIEQLMAAAAVSAADALSRLLNHQIQVGSSRLYRGDQTGALMDHLRGRDRLLTVSQTAYGADSMKVSLVVEDNHACCLVDMLMGRHGGSRQPNVAGDEPDSLDCAANPNPGFDFGEIDALKEAANIVAGSCAAVLAPELGLERMSLPSIVQPPSLSDRVGWFLPDDRSMCAESRLKSLVGSLELELMMSISRLGQGVESSTPSADVTSKDAGARPAVRRLAAGRARR
jgi:chemotaxis protein CheY-P-specific phosphatase CheC